MIYSEFDMDNYHCFLNVRNISLASIALMFVSILYHVLASTSLPLKIKLSKNYLLLKM